jgi:hypothetical protein
MNMVKTGKQVLAPKRVAIQIGHWVVSKVLVPDTDALGQ